MKRRFFAVIWWVATVGLCLMVLRWWQFLSTIGLPERDSFWWPHLMRTGVWPLIAVAVLYLVCFIGYVKAYRPPKPTDFSPRS